VGCATGEHALLAAELGLEATVVDTSPRAIAIARGEAIARGLAARFLAMPSIWAPRANSSTP